MLTIHFSDVSLFPDSPLRGQGRVSNAFLERGVSDLRAAAIHVKGLPYWKNDDRSDVLGILEEGHGTCVSKHDLIAALAQETGIAVYRYEGVYPLNDTIVTGVSRFLEPYGLQDIPRTHCFLECCGSYFDLTDGNCTGKNGLIKDFLRIEKVQRGAGKEVLVNFLEDLCKSNAAAGRLGVADYLRILDECVEYNFGLCKRDPQPGRDRDDAASA